MGLQREHDQVATPTNATRHAVVIGAGMAGLWAARVLTEHFARVTVVERDRLPERSDHRRGVPQAYHAHTLLARGQRELERLFPELDAELAAAGAPRVDWTWDCRSFFRTGWVPRYRSGLTTRTCSRDLLEWSVRRALARRGVEFREGRDVLGLCHDMGTDRVTGVRLGVWGEGVGSSSPEVLAADLVIDASGRNSRTPEWLAALGYGRVRETVVDPSLGYASRIYRRPPAMCADWRAMVVSSVPISQARGGVIYPIEEGCWLVTLAGIGGDYPPTDEEGFLAFAQSLATPALYEAIADAEPLSPIRGYRRTENRLRHYERFARWPTGFVALGDATCTFDPVYGQGMTVSALGARVLDRCLRVQRRRWHPDGDLRGLGGRFQRRLALSNATPWLLATSEDFRWPTTIGKRPGLLIRFAHRYLDRVLALLVEDPTVAQAFFVVLHLLRSPTALLFPSVLRRVIFGAVVRHRRA